MKGESGVDPGFSFLCFVEDKKEGSPVGLPRVNKSKYQMVTSKRLLSFESM